MSMSNRHITSLSEFFNYLKNKLSHKEMHSFEKRMMQDSFESDAYEGFIQYDEEIINSDLKKLKHRLCQKKKNKYIYLKIAASVIVIVTFSVVLFQLRLEDKTLISDNRNSELSVEKDIVPIPYVDVPEQVKEDGEVLLKHEEMITNEKPKTQSKKSIKKKSEIKEEPKEKELLVDKIHASETENKVYEIENVDVIGYGAVKNETITGSVATVTKSEISSRSKEAIKSNVLKGKVVDETGMPLPGVNVNIKGTTIGAITNVDGEYEITGVDSSSVLRYAFIGYETNEIKAEEVGKEVFLEPSLLALDEVVTVGYGTQRKEVDPSYIPAKPEGGYSKYKAYILEHLVHPDVTMKKKQVVVFKLKIGSTGKIVDFKVVKSPGEEYTQEAIRVLKSGPNWIPSKRNGINEESQVTYRVVFKRN